MPSLRQSLGLTVAIALFVLTLIAALAISYERWQEESVSLPLRVELEAFRLSETQTTDGLLLDSVGGVDQFAMIFDSSAQLTSSAGEITDAVLEYGQDAWTETTEQDVAYSRFVVAESGNDTYLTAVACIDESVCDTVVVASSQTSFASYAASRSGWLLLPALIAALAGFVAARLLVGRALKPVEAMRSQVETITATRLDRRVPVADTGDEIQQLGETLNSTLDRLQSASQATERFASDAAHELRSPITGVRAAIELRANNDELLQESISELDRASQLVDDLLFLARNEGTSPAKSEVDLDDIAREAVASAQSRFTDVTIESELHPARLTANPMALRRIITNLIDNAARYGSGRVKVTISPDSNGTSIVHIDDNGPGIGEENRTVIFERFSRLDESRSRQSGGTGLGLAMVAELTADHHGTIEISESPLGGARFTLSLPEHDNASSS